MDFGLDGDIPRYWFNNNPFQTRVFDAMSVLFPMGERFFIACVRDYRDQVLDPALQQDIKAFIWQEGQHTHVHNQYNKRLKQQGIDVDRIERRVENILFGFLRKKVSRQYTLAQTAALEHLTAIMAHSFFARKDVLGRSDPRMSAMFAWHAMEEVEHKAVAFDVMQKVAKVRYPLRVLAMFNVSIGFPLHSMLIVRHMLKVDGFSFIQRLGMLLKGLWWLYGPKGLFSSVLGHYARYYKPSFHPQDDGQLKSYEVWLEAFNRTGDPMQASEALRTMYA
jgi:predicted metal-dependent hydrolase